MDRISREKRSRIMSGIRGKWTGPERFAHGLLIDHGIAHTMHPKVPGNPDILIDGKGIAIFIQE